MFATHVNTSSCSATGVAPRAAGSLETSIRSVPPSPNNSKRPSPGCCANGWMPIGTGGAPAGPLALAASASMAGGPLASSAAAHANASNEAELAALHERLKTWAPRGAVVSFLTDTPSPELIVSLGVTQNCALLQKMFTAYIAEGKENPELFNAFTHAFHLCQRRCATQVQPVMRQLIDHATVISADTALRLAHMVSDIGTKDDSRALLAKCASVPGLSNAFYLELLRHATEAMTPPDMGLALEVVDNMKQKGQTHTTGSLKLLLIGFGRMAQPPIQPALRLMRFVVDASPDMAAMCLANPFFNVIDSAVSCDAKEASEFVKNLPPDVVNIPIATACVEPPSLYKSGTFDAPCTTYILVDPFTVDLSRTLPVPQHSYLVFLYSTVRVLESRALSVCSSNPMSRKLHELRNLLHTVKETVVVPYDVELGCRATLPLATERPMTHQDRLMMFAKITNASSGPSFKIKVLSADPAIVKACGTVGIEVLRALPETAPAPPPAQPHQLHPFEAMAMGTAPTSAPAGSQCTSGRCE